jgi:VanZ family protein
VTDSREQAVRIAFAFGIVVTVATLAPAGTGGGAPEVAIGPVGLDKLLHAGGFFVLTLLAGRASEGGRIGFALAVGLVALGGGLELAQSFIPGRTTDVFDFLANTVGVVAGMFVHRWHER